MEILQSLIDVFAGIALKTDPILAAVFLIAVMALFLVGMALYVVHTAILRRGK